MPSLQTRKNEKMWSGVVLLMVVSLLVGVYFLRMTYGTWAEEVKIDPNLVVVRQNLVKSKAPAAEVYENDSYRFKVSYPLEWQVTTSHTGEGEDAIFSFNLSKSGKEIGVSVMSPELEGLVKNSISISSETEVLVSGVQATRLIGGSAKDGSPVSLVIVKNNNYLYSLRGIGEDFDNFVKNFSLLK